MLKLDKVLPFIVGNTIGHTLKGMALSDEGYTYDHIKLSVIGSTGDNVLDEVGYDNVDSMIVSYLDSIGCKAEIIENLLSSNDAHSMDAVKVIAHSFDKSYTLDEIADLAISFADENALDEVTLDSMPPVKAGYKRTQVIRKGKKKWINKRDPNKKVILSSKQRQGLMKARLKAHTGLAEQGRKRSLSKRKSLIS